MEQEEAATAARVVLRFLHSKLAEQKAKAADRMRMYEGANEAGVARLDDPLQAELEDDDASKWVYDIQMVSGVC